MQADKLLTVFLHGVGIDVSDLVVLEAHVVYSLSKPNSATQLYMVKCKQSIDIRQRFSFENLLERSVPLIIIFYSITMIVFVVIVAVLLMKIYQYSEDLFSKDLGFYFYLIL